MFKALPTDDRGHCSQDEGEGGEWEGGWVLFLVDAEL